MKTLIFTALLLCVPASFLGARETRVPTPQVPRELHIRYALQLIYSEAPELRTESLCYLEDGPHAAGTSSEKAAFFVARFRYGRDPETRYRWVEVVRDATNRTKPPVVRLTLGLSRAVWLTPHTHKETILASDAYVPKPK
jgi:hypothetical protein